MQVACTHSGILLLPQQVPNSRSECLLRQTPPCIPLTE